MISRCLCEGKTGKKIGFPRGLIKDDPEKPREDRGGFPKKGCYPDACMESFDMARCSITVAAVLFTTVPSGTSVANRSAEFPPTERVPEC